MKCFKVGDRVNLSNEGRDLSDNEDTDFDFRQWIEMYGHFPGIVTAVDTESDSTEWKYIVTIGNNMSPEGFYYTELKQIIDEWDN